MEEGFSTPDSESGLGMFMAHGLKLRMLEEEIS